MTINFYDTVTAFNTGFVARRPFNRRNDGQHFILNTDHNANTAKRTLGLNHKLFKHLGIHID
ncbi:hypothetical protein SDC9_140886 [bioreactor metagenome]|uniref:Uncharacterized protein n=1 Tax=bioreactor metagenome TaxID=1076179 RepID=A0A645DW55_9ZZZZ